MTNVSEAIVTADATRTVTPGRGAGALGEHQPSSAAPGVKRMQTFRMSRELVLFLRGEAERSSRDLTGYVVRCLDGIRTDFGLPAVATALLEADRKALGMERVEYLLHVLYQRSLLLREQGPGFDGPSAVDPRR